ncbi:HAD family hydrolase [Paramicrobacterium chengjingii]|uniref:HAD family hydrolase n=1 Tax=Paramicrobacterium chengjingii TaxID=2769067 RepID=UPI001AB051A6|nr:HAD family hydrolase [Microbacterium chengjingii]
MTMDAETLTIEPARRIDDDVEFYDVPVELAVLDLTGTTVRDAGLAEAAFTRAAEHVGLVQSEDSLTSMLTYLRDATGRSTIDVFRSLTADEATAQSATAAFDAEYLENIGSLEAVDGAEHTLHLLRDAEVSIAFITGLPRDTVNAIVAHLGWQESIDVALCAADAGRGIPFPDLPLTALMRTGAQSVDSMVVVGDTVNHVRSGLAAGAGLVVGVLTGAHSAEQLHQAGADDVLGSIAMLPAMLGVSSDV